MRRGLPSKMEKNDFTQLKVLLHFWINLLTSPASNRESLRSVPDGPLSFLHTRGLDRANNNGGTYSLRLSRRRHVFILHI